MCGCCSYEIHFSFNKWEGGRACRLFGTVAMQLSWEFGTWLFGLHRISLQLLMLPGVSALKNKKPYIDESAKI